MTPSFDHSTDTPPSNGGWHNLGLLTASLAVVLVVSATVNLTRHTSPMASVSADQNRIPVSIQISSAIAPNIDTGSDESSGALEPTVQVDHTPVIATVEFDAAPIPKIPTLTTLPDKPAPKPVVPAVQPEARQPSPPQTGPTTPTQKQTPPSTTSGGTPAVQQLEFGVGEGRQPQPNYPSRALSRGQKGSVVVQFTVTESGEVEQAKAVKPSRYPELNKAAISTILQQWKFPAGEKRIYQISIDFKIR